MKNERLKSGFFKDSFWNFFSAIIGRLGGFLFTIFLARLLLPEGFGLYSLATSIALLFLAIIDLGINQAMIRYVSVEFNKKSKKVKAYFNYFFTVKFILSIIISLLLIILAWPIANLLFNKPEIFIPLIILSFYIVILSAEGILESLFYIKKGVKYIAVRETIFQLSRVIFLAIIFYLISKDFPLLAAFISLLIASIFVFIFSYSMTRDIFVNIKDYSLSREEKRKLLKFIWHLMWINISGTLFAYVDVLILGLFVSNNYLGFYKAALTIIIGIAGMFFFFSIALPVLATAPKNKLTIIFNRIIEYTSIITLPAVFGLIFLSNYIIRIVYGYLYLEATPILCYLSPLIFFMVTIGFFSSLFSAREKPQEFTKLTLLVVVMNLILNYLLINILINVSEHAATIGVAIITSISWSIYFLGSILIAKKRLNVDFNWKILVKPLIASLFMSLFLYYFNVNSANMTLIKGILEVALGVLLYSLCLIILGAFKKKDIAFFVRQFLPSNRIRG